MTTSRRDFTKYLAAVGAGLAAQPTQLLAFEKYYEANTPFVLKTFVRDSIVRLKFNFFDVDGNVVDPAAAQVTISYCPHTSGDPSYVIYPLTKEADSDDWVYEWDSSVAAAGVISVHAEITDGQHYVQIDGRRDGSLMDVIEKSL